MISAGEEESSDENTEVFRRPEGVPIISRNDRLSMPANMEVRETQG